MAVPRGKISKSKRDKRRANWKIELPGLAKCSQCHEIKLPHRVCPLCGYYKGKEVVKVK
ncbi:MAG: 50S ribosomal protein L32 [Dethiobacteria bacterium]